MLYEICMLCYGYEYERCSSYTILREFQFYGSFKFHKKTMLCLYDLRYTRYVCYGMIRGIFMFMYLMLVTKRIVYVFKNKFLGSQSEEP